MSRFAPIAVLLLVWLPVFWASSRTEPRSLTRSTAPSSPVRTTMSSNSSGSTRRPRTRTEYLMAAGDFDGDGGIDFAGRSTCGSCASVKTVHLR